MRTMRAKFAGKCRACQGAIGEGDLIVWAKGAGGRHSVCGTAIDTSGTEFDVEAEMARRDEAEYQRGYHEVASIQAFSAAGSALRESMYLEMEMAAYNRGEDY